MDESRIGATSVSLDGWLGVQTALNDRIQAVAEYGTRLSAYEVDAGELSESGTSVTSSPKAFRLGDRNLMLPFAPRPLLSGHGRHRPQYAHTQWIDNTR